MILDTDEVMENALDRMDDAYTALRKIVSDESVFNTDCIGMQNARAALNNAISDVFDARIAFRAIKYNSREVKP